MRDMPPPTRIPTCHPDRKHATRGLCASCNSQAWNKAHPERVKANRKHIQRKLSLWHTYGMTPEEYEARWRAQDGRCANPGCRAPRPMSPPSFKRALLVDHCHATGIVRGLLCGACNSALGLARDDPDRLQGLIDYLAAVRVSRSA